MSTISTDRRPVEELLDIYKQLQAYGWKIELICRQSNIDPIYAYLSPAAAEAKQNHPANSFWILGGVHGEEPAPQEAFANELQTLITFGKTTPIVFMPMLNPKARRMNWRYENEPQDFTKGHSVADSEYLMRPNVDRPPSATAISITQWVLKTSQRCLPILAIDHHEDLGSNQCSYIYVSGKDTATQSIASVVLDTMKSAGVQIADSGKTRFGEEIKKGMVVNSADGSIDEFLANQAINTVLVVETAVPADGSISFEQRITAHQAVIREYIQLWQLHQH